MTDLDTLKHKLDYIFGLQFGLPGLLTGLYLDQLSISLLSDELSKEDKVPISVGRYKRVPVYEQFAIPVARQKTHGEYRGIVYTYVPMLCVD